MTFDNDVIYLVTIKKVII